MGYYLSKTQLKMFGATPFLIENVCAALENVCEMISSDKEIKELLARLTNSVNYLADHSLYILILGLRVIKELGWEQGNVKSQFSLACLFHDISLEDNEVCRTSNLQSISKIKDKRANESLLKHPYDNSQLIDKLPNDYIQAKNIMNSLMGWGSQDLLDLRI